MRQVVSSPRFRLSFCLAWTCTALLYGGVPPAAGETLRSDPAHLQAVVDSLREQLAIRHEVVVELVPVNPRVVSVERHREREGAFHLSVEEGFFEVLTADERLAALAHELGHVWIFTNHPYLQTEQLANRIAMRVVSRESLARVYEKMWARSGAKGDLRRYLGEDPHTLDAAHTPLTAEAPR